MSELIKQRRQEFLINSIAHYEADEMLVKGFYGEMNEQFKGCSVGCHLSSIYPDQLNDIEEMPEKHKKVAEYYYYPEWMAHLQDELFEGLPRGENREWHRQLAKAVAALPVDYDWQKALHRVHIAILRISYRTADHAKGSVQTVIGLHEQAINGDLPDSAAWSAARSAAWSAEESAVWSAEESAAWSAEESAVWSAVRSAARSAAWSAEESAARSAAWSAEESAAWSAAHQEIRDAVLLVLSGETQ